MNLKVVDGHQSDLLMMIDRKKNKRARTLVNMMSSNPPLSKQLNHENNHKPIIWTQCVSIQKNEWASLEKL